MSKGGMRSGGTLAARPAVKPLAQAELERALALHRRGQRADAERIYRSILQAQPRFPNASHMLGLVLMDRGATSEALHHLGEAVAANPKDFGAQFNLGNALDRLGRRDEALACFDRAIALKPDFAEAFNNRGNVLSDLGRAAAALASYDRAVALRPDDASAWGNRGNVLSGLRRFHEALASYDRAIALKPGFRVFYNRGNCLRSLGRAAEALTSFDRAIALKPDYAQALNSRGAALLDLQHWPEALACFDRALVLDPDYAEALYNRGAALRELGRLDAALASYDRAVALRPDDRELRRNRGLCRLLAGDLAGGWPDHECRWDAPGFASQQPRLASPPWAGEDVAGKSILVHSEQGIGDVLQFCRYLPLLAERGADVSFLCPKPLVSILRTLPNGIRLIDSVAADAAFDVQCALMSLPLGFATDLASIPHAVPYLAADPRRGALWRQRLGAQGFTIGIAWQGNPGNPIDRGRSIPLREFQPLAQVPGVRLISLQKHHGLDQLGDLPPGMAVETLGDDFDAGPDAFADTAAVLQQIDLLVTSDSAIAHLAGALGRPAWIALKAVPDWRWLMARSDSPWYPTARLFRQRAAGDWRGVFEAMADELRLHLAEAEHVA